jgi:predicted nucleotidyltransferase
VRDEEQAGQQAVLGRAAVVEGGDDRLASAGRGDDEVAVAATCERPRAYTSPVGIRERVDEMRAAVLRAAELHGARNVRVLGSVARGEAGLDSDLDLLVELDKGRSLLDHAALVIELEALLGCKVDVATEQGLRPRVRDRVLAEAVPL